MPEGEQNFSPSSQEKREGSEAVQLFEAIILVAENSTGTDDEVARVIADQLKELMGTEDFAHYFVRLDPDAYYSKTKLLKPEAKKHLNAGIELFSKEVIVE